MYAVTNPLDYYDSFIEEAIKLTYSYVASSKPFLVDFYSIPSLDAIEAHLPAHFEQELALMLITNDDFECVGVKDENELIHRIRNKEFRQFIPNKNEVVRHLDMLNLTFLEYCTQNYCSVRNSSVVEVW